QGSASLRQHGSRTVASSSRRSATSHPARRRGRLFVEGSQMIFRIRSTAVSLSVLLLLSFPSRPARADDWLQWRHDAQRTAASRDRVVLPLTEIWEGAAPGAIWHGRALCLDGMQHPGV